MTRARILKANVIAALYELRGTSVANQIKNKIIDVKNQWREAELVQA
jgi:hypothetical protein